MTGGLVRLPLRVSQRQPTQRLQLVQRFEWRAGRDRCFGHGVAPLAFSARSSSQRFCFGDRCTTSKRPARSSRLSRNSSDRAVNRRAGAQGLDQVDELVVEHAIGMSSSVRRHCGRRRRWRWCSRRRCGDQPGEVVPVEAVALEHPLDRRHRADPLAVVIRRQQRQQLAELVANRRRQRTGRRAALMGPASVRNFVVHIFGRGTSCRAAGRAWRPRFRLPRRRLPLPHRRASAAS